MAEYIDREVAKKALGDAHFKNYGNAIMVIMDIPTADVRPVVCSKWIPFPNDGVWDFKCDICHRVIPFGQTPDTMKYCHNCGADMREES